MYSCWKPIFSVTNSCEQSFSDSHIYLRREMFKDSLCLHYDLWNFSITSLEFSVCRSFSFSLPHPTRFDLSNYGFGRFTLSSLTRSKDAWNAILKNILYCIVLCAQHTFVYVMQFQMIWLTIIIILRRFFSLSLPQYTDVSRSFFLPVFMFVYFVEISSKNLLGSAIWRECNLIIISKIA